jgi:hypothetical protein
MESVTLVARPGFEPRIGRTPSGITFMQLRWEGESENVLADQALWLTGSIPGPSLLRTARTLEALGLDPVHLVGYSVEDAERGTPSAIARTDEEIRNAVTQALPAARVLATISRDPNGYAKVDAVLGAA